MNDQGKAVTFSIGREALAYNDELAHTWVAEAGNFEVLPGASAQDIRATATFMLADSSRWLYLFSALRKERR